MITKLKPFQIIPYPTFLSKPQKSFLHFMCLKPQKTVVFHFYIFKIRVQKSCKSINCIFIVLPHTTFWVSRVLYWILKNKMLPFKAKWTTGQVKQKMGSWIQDLVLWYLELFKNIVLLELPLKMPIWLKWLKCWVPKTVTYYWR